MKRFNKEMLNSKNAFINKVQTPLEIHIYLMFFKQTLNDDEVCQVRVNSRNFGFTQTWKNNT